MSKETEPRNIAPVFWDVAMRDKGMCVYCELDGSKDLRILISFQLDHLVPRNSGGEDDPKNLVLACAPCNRDKSIWDPREGQIEPPPSHEALVKNAKAHIDRLRGTACFYTELQKALSAHPAEAPKATEDDRIVPSLPRDRHVTPENRVCQC